MPEIPELHVKRADLAEGLRILLRSVKKKDAGDAIVSFADGEVSIEAGGVTAVAGAEGLWPGEAVVSADFVYSLAKTLPDTDPLLVRYEEGRLFVDRFSAPCRWSGVASKRIELPLGAPTGWFLAVALKYSDQEISNSGLTPLVEDAKKRRDTCVANATKALQPLGLDSESVEECVDNYVRRTWKV